MTIALRRWCDEPRYMASMSTHMRPAALVTFSSGSVVVVLQLSDSNRHCTAACLTSTGSDVAARVRAMSWDDELLIVSVRRWRVPLSCSSCPCDDEELRWALHRVRATMKSSAGRCRRRRRRVTCLTRRRHRSSRHQATTLQRLRLRLRLAKPRMSTCACNVLTMSRAACRINRFHAGRLRRRRCDSPTVGGLQSSDEAVTVTAYTHYSVTVELNAPLL